MIGYSKKNKENIRESAFDSKKKKPGLKFNLRLALTGVRTTGPRSITKLNKITDVIQVTLTVKMTTVHAV